MTALRAMLSATQELLSCVTPVLVQRLAGRWSRERFNASSPATASSGRCEAHQVQLGAETWKLPVVLCTARGWGSVFTFEWKVVSAMCRFAFHDFIHTLMLMLRSAFKPVSCQPGVCASSVIKSSVG
jgi:hypothetical protein